MGCEICGYSWCNSSHTCPECARKRVPLNNPRAKEDVQAGHNFGVAVIKIFTAFFLNRYLCLVTFGFFGYMLLYAAGVFLGVGPDGMEPKDVAWEDVPFWYHLFAITPPVVAAVLLRKYIRLFMKWVFIIGIAALVIWMAVDLTLYLKNR